MTPETIDQARFLHKSINSVQGKTLKQHGLFDHKNSGLSSELTATQLTMLMTVRDHDNMTLKEIAGATHVSSPSASTMVDKLVEAGALVREHSKVDRRKVRVSISTEGLRAVEYFEKRMLSSLTELLEGIGPAYSKMWCEVYERIETYIQKLDSSNDEENKTVA